jgi:beta-glucosidase/6-phospho-beta-glucosidase/beta-galactosidase
MDRDSIGLFDSFFFAGFECTTGYNVHGEFIDQIAATRHDFHCREDYALLRSAGLFAAREGVRWPMVDRPQRYDFSSVQPFLNAACDNGIQVIWDLFHFGYPERIDPFSNSFADCFANYCGAIALHIARATDGPLYFTPVNEPSYFAWAGGEMALFAPHTWGRGAELKICLVQAAIAGINAIREVCPDARIVSVDPLCRVAAKSDRSDLKIEAQRFNNEIVFQSWDMLSGRLLPELGGSPEHLDIVGVNYYATNQWDIEDSHKMLAEGDPRHWSLARLIGGVSERYGREILITESSGSDGNRAAWVEKLAAESITLLRDSVPLRGVCLYPILSMPEWHDRNTWIRRGLWDLVSERRDLKRMPNEPMWAAVRGAEQVVTEAVANGGVAH